MCTVSYHPCESHTSAALEIFSRQVSVSWWEGDLLRSLLGISGEEAVLEQKNMQVCAKRTAPCLLKNTKL
jgi:hypothetical protein